MERVYNFSAGPSVMPEEVLARAGKEILNYGASGQSVMEMSHRSREFGEIFDYVKTSFRDIFQVPDSHEILFLQGGGTLQFSAVAMNLLAGGCADYAVTGNFSGKAAEEASRYGDINIAVSTAPEHDRIPAQSEMKLNPDAKYFYYCSNNTVYGTEWQYIPQTKAPLVCDMSSDILSYPVDIGRYGLIFAGAQKNLAPAGLTVVIIDRKLAGFELPDTPKIMSYKVMIDNDSMLNTPPCWCIYMLGLTLDWIRKNGGAAGMDEIRRLRAGKLYDFLDGSALFKGHAAQGSRSFMNVTFSTGDKDTDACFVKEAAGKGLVNLKGHKVAGGMRASLYNAMPVEGVDALISFMKEFEANHV